jgi:hypothetical protein
MKIKGKSIAQWSEWVDEELTDDGRESQVYGPQGRDVYRYTMEAFRDALNMLSKSGKLNP